MGITGRIKGHFPSNLADSVSTVLPFRLWGPVNRYYFIIVYFDVEDHTMHVCVHVNGVKMVQLCSSGVMAQHT